MSTLQNTCLNFGDATLVCTHCDCTSQRKWFSKWVRPKVDKVFIGGFCIVETF